MRSGLRNSLIRVYQRGKADGQAQYSNDRGETTTLFAEVFVSIVPKRGKETYVGDQDMSRVTTSIRGDYLELQDVTEDMIIYFDPTGEFADEALIRKYDIVAVLPNHESQEDVIIHAEEKRRGYGV